MNIDIPPLQKRTRDGEPYVRPAEIKSAILRSLKQPFEEVLRRAKCKDRRHPDYLPSEVLVHRIRATRGDNSDDQFNALYALLSERIVRSCPNAVVQLSNGVGELAGMMDVRESVMDRFVTLILKDRDSYAEGLDIFEARFDRAVQSLRADAHRKVTRREQPLAPMESEESGGVPEDFEQQAVRLSTPSMTVEDELTYRLQIRRAIDSLPESERRVMDMLEADIPIESKNPGEASIASLLGCTPKTVRNRRARAFQKIQVALGMEN